MAPRKKVREVILDRAFKTFIVCLLSVILLVAPSTAVTIYAKGPDSHISQVYLPVVGFEHDPVRFAVIGDLGKESLESADVARLVKSWQPDLILTLGDNNLDDGEASTIDRNVGQYYCDFIYPYYGRYDCPDQETFNRFFPTLGNHDRQITFRFYTRTGMLVDEYRLAKTSELPGSPAQSPSILHRFSISSP